MAVSAAVPALSALSRANAASTESWQRDLKSLFDHAKERFPDVVWDLTSDYDSDTQEDVWGHKAIVYARAPPSFLAQYFDVRPNGASRIFSASPLPGENPTQSTFSLSLQDGRSVISPTGDGSASPTPSGTLGMLRLSTDVLPALFANQLEYLYTGAGIGDAFEFLFDSQEEEETAGDVEAHRIDKLRKDLVFMWRSRLYSDVRIELTGPFAPNGEIATAVFSSHRFILASRSPYFRSLFLSGSFAPLSSTSPSSPITISLPSPPFTPPSLHFTLGYIYSGTLFFSNRTFDLDSAFQIYRSAIYLSLDELQAEMEARIVEEMMHGFYHAYLTLEEYNDVTGGRWGVGGCHCKTCVRRAPRILEFALADDVKNPVLERGARRALVGLFGEGWATPEFAALPVKARTNALRGVQARTTPPNVFPLLFAAQAALTKLTTSVEKGTLEQPMAESIRELVLAARNKIDEVLCAHLDEALEQEEWLALLENDGAGFNDTDQVALIMSSIKRGLTDSNAPMVYQHVVNLILLRSQTNPATGETAPVLSSISPIRKATEQCRLDILKWLRKRWLNVRNLNGFEPLEDWSLKEISDGAFSLLHSQLQHLINISAMKSRPSNPAVATPPAQSTSLPTASARGITLQVGIPCMISSKRKRFKAFARYIGEVDGEDGPWIGVEVPLSEGWTSERLQGRDWNDGSHKGVRYFEVGAGSNPSPSSLASSGILMERDTEERAARRRRVDAVLSASSRNRKKREGDSLFVEQERLKRLRSASPAVSETSSLESRGLFVRPSQVLLVMDAAEQR
ncbi:hypothetical protein DL93DRAFT_2052982 [Clavulina sp. PMI_390]|nr:hypothetical protein DL93DRAFT_2052982 [Clavulina sp. PMI_390]